MDDFHRGFFLLIWGLFWTLSTFPTYGFGPKWGKKTRKKSQKITKSDTSSKKLRKTAVFEQKFRLKKEDN